MLLAHNTHVFVYENSMSQLDRNFSLSNDNKGCRHNGTHTFIHYFFPLNRGITNIMLYFFFLKGLSRFERDAHFSSSPATSSSAAVSAAMAAGGHGGSSSHEQQQQQGTEEDAVGTTAARLRRHRSYHSPSAGRRFRSQFQTGSGTGGSNFKRVTSVKVSQREHSLPPLPTVNIRISPPDDNVEHWQRPVTPSSASHTATTSSNRQITQHPTEVSEIEMSANWRGGGGGGGSGTAYGGGGPTSSTAAAAGSSWQHQQQGGRPMEGRSDEYYACYSGSTTMTSGGGHEGPKVFTDQFDEFVYKSKHIGHTLPTWNHERNDHHLEEEYDDNDEEAFLVHAASAAGGGGAGGVAGGPFPPEVNIEVPSDSDSSRRPSKASFSGCVYGGTGGTASPRRGSVSDTNSPTKNFNISSDEGGNGKKRKNGVNTVGGGGAGNSSVSNNAKSGAQDGKTT